MTNLLHVVLLFALSGTNAASLDELGFIEQTHNDLAAHRTLHIARLHEYAARGVFPKNKDFPDRHVPYFVDEAGTACAVGHLMRLDGQESLVESIASSTNHIRIENVHGGPLLDWIRESGLTRVECALIQPSYATITDYRRGRDWQNEIARLQKHFAKVEKTLVSQTQQSLRKSLIAKVDAQLVKNPNDPALAMDALSDALSSDEPNVRIAAAYAMSQISDPPKSARLDALKPNLSDTDLNVRFWTAVAIEKIGAASTQGKMELHYLSLPIFLDAAQNGDDSLRLPALIQLANTAPMTMGSFRQFRIMPEIRRTLVQACDDENPDIRQFANSVLQSWRWQRVAYESQRIPRQYLADSADLESLATEALALGREFAEQLESIKNIVDLRSNFDLYSTRVYLLPLTAEATLPIAQSPDEAKQLVDKYLNGTYERYRDQTESTWPFWEVVSAETDRQSLYYVVETKWLNREHSSKTIYIVPRPPMLSSANCLPSYWFDRESLPVSDARAGRQRDLYHPKADAQVVLGNLARSDKEVFSTACDILAFFQTHHSQLVLDRTVDVLPDEFVWTGRFAMLRAHNPRFFGEGIGPHTFGAGGWDFHQFSFRCDQITGKLTLSAEPIEYPLSQLPTDVLSPDWFTQELKLMGWRPLESLDFFNDALLPREYHEAIDTFDLDDPNEARRMLHRRYVVERGLPYPELVLGLLFERAGDRETAKRIIRQAAASERHDPHTLADVARWELSVGLYDDARKHAEAALALWPEHPQARDVFEQLDERE